MIDFLSRTHSTDAPDPHVIVAAWRTAFQVSDPQLEAQQEATIAKLLHSTNEDDIRLKADLLELLTAHLTQELPHPEQVFIASTLYQLATTINEVVGIFESLDTDYPQPALEVWNDVLENLARHHTHSAPDNGANWERLLQFFACLANYYLPNDKTYSSIIHAARHYDELLALRAIVRGLELPPNAALYYALLYRAPDYATARNLFELMRLEGLEITELAYRALLGKTPSLEETHKLYAEMRIMRIPFAPPTDFYLASMRKAPTLEAAQGVFEEMVEAGVPPNGAAYYTLLLKTTDYTTARRYFKQFDTNGLHSDITIYNTLFIKLKDDPTFKAEKATHAPKLTQEATLPPDTALSEALKHYPAAAALVVEMTKRGIAANATTYNTLIQIVRYYHERRYLFEQMQAHQLTPDLHTYHALMGHYAESKDHAGIAALFNDLVAQGITPNSSTFNFLVSTAKDYAKIEGYFTTMRRYGIEPNVINYNIWMSTAPTLSEARAVYYEMLQRNLELSTFTYNTLMAATNDYEQARHYFQEMRARGIEPNAVNYNTLLNLSKSFEVGMVLKAEMQELGLVPTERFYTALLFWAKQFDKAFALFAEMNEQGLRRNIVHYNTLISLTQNYDTALALFSEISTRGLTTDRTTFTLMVTKAKELRYAAGFVEQMREKGYPTDTPIHNILINLAPDYATAQDYFRAMVEGGCAPDTYSFVSLLRHLIGNHTEAAKVLAELPNYGLVVNMPIYRALVAVGKDFDHLLPAFLELRTNTPIPTYLYNITMGTTRSFEKAFPLLGYMKADGVQPDSYTYNILAGMTKELSKALALFDDLKHSGIEPDAYTYNQLIPLIRRYDQAYSLYREMMSANHSPSIYALNNLISLAPDYVTAQGHFEVMAQHNLAPNQVVYNTLIKKAPVFETAWEVYQQLKAAEYAPDLQTFMPLLSKISEERHLQLILEEIHQYEVFPDERMLNLLYNIILYLRADYVRLFQPLVKHETEPRWRELWSGLVTLLDVHYPTAVQVGDTVPCIVTGYNPKRTSLMVDVPNERRLCHINQGALGWVVEDLVSEVAIGDELSARVIDISIIYGINLSLKPKESEDDPERPTQPHPEPTTAPTTTHTPPPANNSANAAQLVQYNKLLTAERDEAAIEALLEIMQIHGVQPDYNTYNILLSRVKDYSRAQTLFAEMQQRGIRPNGYTYNNLMRLAPNLEAALALLDEMFTLNLRRDTFTYNTLMGFAEGYDGAIGFFEQMRASEIMPDIVSYNILLKKSETFERVEEVYAKIAEQGLKPDRYSVATLLTKATAEPDMVFAVQALREAEMMPNFKMRQHLLNKALQYPFVETILIDKLYRETDPEWDTFWDGILTEYRTAASAPPTAPRTTEVKIATPPHELVLGDHVEAFVRGYNGKRTIALVRVDGEMRRCYIYRHNFSPVVIDLETEMPIGTYIRATVTGIDEVFGVRLSMDGSEGQHSV